MDADALYRAIVETSPDAIWMTDLDDCHLFANPTMAQYFDTSSPAEMRGGTMYDTLDDLGRTQYASHLEIVKGCRDNSEPVECLFITRQRERHWVLLQESPLLDEHGELERLVYRITSFDEHRRVHDELEQSRSELAEAQRIARVGKIGRAHV